ncbi:DNA mismatch repair endonuclease MutL [Ruminococcaceae bacterium AM07-15]|nr:DNA mismatch repair endonuclease MutL [Ruminococcaceae bacterium AM07-15]
MGKISVLAPQVANMIAAGEVVERPASVVKELLENALDAGADAVTVEIRQGGITYIRVTDNGGGMEPEDAPTAFLRHATSKIRGERDLESIHTLGFRGEALAAIASVSRVDLFTKTRSAPLGLHLALEGGEIIEQEETGCPDGTTIVIKDLFFNTPARMKFLKKDSTEASYVEQAAEQVALAHPGLTLKFIKDGKEGLYTPGDGNMMSVLYAIYGGSFTKELLTLHGGAREAEVMGFVTKPTFSRPNRSMQQFFVNGRPVRSRLLGAAVEQAYQGHLTSGRFPACFLSLKVPAGAVDVNVHPAKLEVKFAREREVFSAIYQVVRSALEGDGVLLQVPQEQEEEPPVPKQPYRPSLKPLFQQPQEEKEQPQLRLDHSHAAIRPSYAPPAPEREEQGSGRAFAPKRNQGEKNSWKSRSFTLNPEENGARRLLFQDGPDLVQGVASQGSAPEGETAKTPVSSPVQQPVLPVEDKDPQSPLKKANAIRVVGEVFSTYILVEGEGEMMLIDKHAAHERMIYNRLERTAEGTSPQVLLTPETVNLSRREKEALLGEGELLRKAGFEVEDFGDGAVILRQVPMYLEKEDAGFVLSDLAEKILSHRKDRTQLYEELLESIACKAAVKAGTFTDDKEREEFARKVIGDPRIRSCPHGRPVIVHLTKREIEKMFKRVL